MIKSKTQVRTLNTFKRAKMVCFANLLLATFTQGAYQTSIDQSQVILWQSQAYSDVASTVRVKTYDSTGSPLTTQDNVQIYIEVTKKCLLTDPQGQCIEVVDADPVPGLPMTVQAAYVGSGEYEASFTIVSSQGTVTVGAFMRPIGLYGEYYTNSNLEGPIAATRYDDSLNMNWGIGPIGPLSVNDSVSVRWTGELYSPTTGSYTFYINADDIAILNIGGTVVSCHWPYTCKFDFDLQADTYNPLTVDFAEGGGIASINILWRKPGDADFQTVPVVTQTTYRVDGVHDVYIAPSSIPALSEITDAPFTHVASATTAYSMLIQSKNMYGKVHDASNDSITVQFFDSGDNLVTQANTVTSLGNGIYRVETFLTLAGEFTVKTTMANGYTDANQDAQTELINSPTTVLVTPGEIDPLLCYTDVPALIPDQTADVPYSFTISFVDKWGNLHYEPTQGGFGNDITVDVKADFVSDEPWRSVILPYHDNLQDTFGTQVIVLTQNLSNGKIDASVTVFHAGIYSLSITIDGVDLIDSPHVGDLVVQPSTINALNCVAADIPSQIYAGFDYSFLIQGRDSFDNIIFQTLEDAVSGATTSATLTFTQNSQISVEGTLDDAAIVEQAGVYQVDFSLPKSLKSGYYDAIVQLGDDPIADRVPMDKLFILPCSNFVALDKGLVEWPGEVPVYVTFEYTIDSDPVTFKLESLAPIKNFYCEHTPVHVLTKVVLYRSIDSGPEEQPLNSLEESFGISLELQGQSPSIRVSSSNSFLDGYVVELNFDATVEEEQTWLATQTVAIGYTWNWESDFETPVAGEETQEFPRFDTDSVNQKMLSLEFDEETEEQFFSPILLNCKDSEEWSQSLPAIEGEDSNNKVQVTVDLGKTSSFLEYRPQRRSFQLKRSGLDKVQSMTQSISIKLKNKQGNESRYQVKVFFTCQIGEDDAENTTYVSEQRYDEDSVQPYIHSISRSGEVVVRFDRPMRQPSLPQETSRRRLNDNSALSYFEDGIIVGTSVKENKNFTLIHESQIMINDTVYPSVSVALKPSDQETLCIDKLDFSWETTGFTAEEWTIQLKFTSPACVSESTNIGDQLVIIILNQMLFTGINGKVVEPETILRGQIPRQMSASAEQAVQLAATASKAIFAGSFFNVLLNILLKASLSQLLNALKNVQIMVHILLIQTYMVAHAEAFLSELRQIVAFEVIDLGDYLKEFLNLGGGQSVDVHFEAVGYESSSSIINLGPIFLIIVILPFYALLMLLMSCCCGCCCTKFFKRKLGNLFFNDIIVFVDGALLIIAVCCTINFYQVQRGFAERNSSYYFALGFILCSLPYILILAGYLCKKFDKISRSAVRNRVGAAYEGMVTRRAGRWIIVFIVLSYARRIALSMIITYGTESNESQRIFMNFGSLFMMGFIAIVRPFQDPWNNRLEMGNEFTILLLYSHCITQTEFVTILEGRAVAGWSMIVLICLNIIVNFSRILVRGTKLVIQRVKFCLIRRQKVAEFKKKLRAAQEARKIQKATTLNHPQEILVVSNKTYSVPAKPSEQSTDLEKQIPLKYRKSKVSYASPNDRKISLKVPNTTLMMSSPSPISALENLGIVNQGDVNRDQAQMIHRPGEGYLLNPHEFLRQDVKEWLADGGNAY